jgi:hypothetical protein
MSMLYPPTERAGKAPEPDLEYIYKEMKHDPPPENCTSANVSESMIN